MPHDKKIINRKTGIIIMIIAGCIIAFAGLMICVLLALSPGKPSPIADENGNPVPGSISEKIFININGSRQGMFIKSRNSENPVLLYLHGGMPDYFLTQKYPTGLEYIFTVVWWEQRGSGISANAEIQPDISMLEQLISDTITVADYLRQRFGKDKIYLMGHSGGTFIGIHTAARAPELFHAYIGIAQMSYLLKSEQLAYDYMLKQFRKNENAEMIRKLEKTPVTMTGGIPGSYLAIRDEAMHSLGIGTTHDMESVITGIFLPSLKFREYTLNEKINLWKAKSRAGVSILWDKMLSTDLSLQLTVLKIPVYFFHGVYDYTCSYTLAKSYFKKIEAPVKGFYSFDQSAHSPIFEEPEKMKKIIKEDVLQSSNHLAD